MPYTPIRTSSSEFINVRGWRYHIQHWMREHASGSVPPLVMLHGFMDVGASFQFVVDALPAPRHVIALDWRGFGLTQLATPGYLDSYWFPDYLGDLDAILDLTCPDAAVDLLGHSMGGNIATTYAGVRPARIRRLINLEGYGLPSVTADQAPQRYQKWLDQLKESKRMRSYANLDAVADRMRVSNSRLTQDKALWLAAHWAQQEAGGQWHLLSDPAHRRVNPILYRDEDAAACRQRITAPTLWVEGAQSDLIEMWGGKDARAAWQARLRAVPDARALILDDCGHMIHHDQPLQLAQLIEQFLGQGL